MAAPVNNSAWLDWVASLMGGQSRQRHAATLPPDRFYCLLDELPVHLVPQPARKCLRTNQQSDTDLVLNPDCTLCVGEELPPELAASRELVSAFALQGTIAWVRDSSCGVLPFWLSPRMEQLVRGLKPNAPVPVSIPAKAKTLLAAARVIVPAGVGAARECGAEQIARASAEFRLKGYAPLSGLIHPFHIAALRRYYRYRIRSGAITLGDRQSPRRYAVHNDAVARFFHTQIAPTLSKVVGQTLKPSYVYMASYLSGAELKKHTDREQCEFSITLCMDFSPEPQLAAPWPIHLETPHGAVTVYQALGDGLAYRGTRLPHYRGILPNRQTSTSIFFHYVAADFTGSLG